MGERARAFAWPSTPVGPVAGWPQSLKTAVRIILNTRFPMFVWWGRGLTFIYNDAYAPFLGQRHPAALGQPAAEVWSDIWPTLSPQIETVLNEGRATWNEARLLIMERNQFREETYFTWSYSPIPDDKGGVGGVLCACTDDTGRVLGERRLKTLRDLGERSLAEARTTAQACRAAAAALAENPHDLPFALIYLRDEDGRQARLSQTVNLAAGTPASPEVVSLDGGDDFWSFRRVLQTGQSELVESLEGKLGRLPAGLWDDGRDDWTRRAFVLPLAHAGSQGGPAGFLVAGLSPLLEWNEEYQSFLALVARQIAIAITSFRGYEIEQAQKALRASEELLRMSLSGARAGAWQWDLVTQEVTWSPEIYDLLGVPHGTKPSFERFLESIDPAERESIPTWFAETAARGGPFELEFRVMRTDGAEMWLSSVGRVVHDAEGKPVLAFGINQDITARRQAERQREEARRTLQLVLEIAQAGVWDWDVVHDRVRGDENLARLFRQPVEDVMAGRLSAEEFFRAMHREDRPRVDQQLREVFAAGGGDYELEYRILHEEEPARWLTARGRVDLGPGGQPERLAGLVFDITERKQAELNSRFLLDLDAALASLADPAGIEQAAVDRLGAYLEVEHCYFAQIAGNRATILNEYRQGGGGDGGIVGEYALDDFYSAEAREQLTEGVPLVVDDVGTDPRTAAWVASFAALGIAAVLIRPVKYQHRWVGALCCVSRAPRAWRADESHLMQDLAARVWPLLEQARASQALREADRRKDEFLAMLAHELRNPLAPIRNAAQVLKLVGNADAHQRWAREVIERQTQHLMRLVDDLLDVSRITQGKVTLEREPLDLATILHRAVEASRPVIDARRHQLTVAPPPEPVRLEGDLTRLVQVVGNLLNNAAKYTDEGGDLRLEAAQEDGEAVIRVRDNGLGVPSDLLPHVFDLFTQADRSLDRSQGGLGIGLTLVRRLVELHGGRVEARSGGSGQGSEFIVRLPAVSAPAAAGVAATAGEPAPPAARGLKILVVEDNVDSAEMMRFMLELAGHEVRTAYDGREALEAARTFEPQAVLCDIGLPGMNGYEVAARLREQPAFRRTPLIALTGYGQEEARRRAEEAGFDHHLVKPVEPDALGGLLDSIKKESATHPTERERPY